jgi:hypothetical protein
MLLAHQPRGQVLISTVVTAYAGWMRDESPKGLHVHRVCFAGSSSSLPQKSTARLNHSSFSRGTVSVAMKHADTEIFFASKKK